MLAAGVAAVIGLFLPFVHVRRPPIGLSFTAKELSFGMEKVRTVVEKQLPGLERRLPKLVDKRLGRVHDAQDDLTTVLEASKFSALAFVPGALLGVLGVIGLLRRRAGRLLGAPAVLFGLISIAGWFGLRWAMGFAVEEAEIDKLEVSMQFGAHFLLGIGVLGVIAGLGALFKPDGAPIDEPLPIPPPPPPGGPAPPPVAAPPN